MRQARNGLLLSLAAVAFGAIALAVRWQIEQAVHSIPGSAFDQLDRLSEHWAHSPMAVDPTYGADWVHLAWLCHLIRFAVTWPLAGIVAGFVTGLVGARRAVAVGAVLFGVAVHFGLAVYAYWRLKGAVGILGGPHGMSFAVLTGVAAAGAVGSVLAAMLGYELGTRLLARVRAHVRDGLQIPRERENL